MWTSAQHLHHVTNNSARLIAVSTPISYTHVDWRSTRAQICVWRAVVNSLVLNIDSLPDTSIPLSSVHNNIAIILYHPNVLLLRCTDFHI